MRRNKVASFFKEKYVITALVLCFVSALALTGVYFLNKNGQNKEQKNLVDLNEELENTKVAEELPNTKEANGGNVVNDAADLPQEAQFGYNNVMDATEEFLPEAEPEAAADASADAEAVNPAPDKGTLNFKESDKLSWPITGNVLMNFSMDRTIYFSTLDQYKYNPALIIQGDVNSKVLSSADGIVESIEVNEETGTTVTVDLGNQFCAVYGQLKEVPLSVGDSVTSGSIVGYVSEPTKYYSVEGSNLFFKVMKDGQPVNPMDFLS